VAAGGNGVGLHALGAGTGAGAVFAGGASGDGLQASGGASAGVGARFQASVAGNAAVVASLIQGDLGGRVLGNTTTAFAGDGAKVVVDTSAGVTLAANGLDAVMTDGVNARQALALVASALAGPCALAGNQITFKSTDNVANRITATVDEAGQRLAVALSPPP
jgi:hypothetical protein